MKLFTLFEFGKWELSRSNNNGDIRWTVQFDTEEQMLKYMQLILEDVK